MNSLVSGIRQHFLSAFSRHVHVAALFIAATTAALFAFAFLLMAAQLSLSEWYRSPVEADLTVAGILVFIALALGMVGESVRRAPRPEIHTPIALTVAVPVAAKIAPKLLNAKVVGIASVVLGAFLIHREFRARS